MERFGKPLTPHDVGRTIVGIAQGEIRVEGPVLGVSGNGVEAL
jgi:hypothetical protein